MGRCPSPSPVVSSAPNEAVVGTSHTSPPNDFKEHQALLKRVASNMRLEAEELAKQSDTLFDMPLAAVAARVLLPAHEGVLRIES